MKSRKAEAHARLAPATYANVRSGTRLDASAQRGAHVAEASNNGAGSRSVRVTCGAEGGNKLVASLEGWCDVSGGARKVCAKRDVWQNAGKI